MNQTRLFIFIFLFICAGNVSAQEFVFLGEGRNDEVRLFWTPAKAWPENLDGFNIKRRSGTEWVKLNNTVIVPGTSIDKDLSNIGLGAATTLTNKRQSLINAGKLRAIATEDMIGFIKDENVLKGLSVALNADFDIALISGFGFVDQNIAEAKRYTYGLFPVYNGVEARDAAATFEWEYGSVPNYEISMEGKVKSRSSKRKEVELLWHIDTEEYKKYRVLNGFNIYRKTDDGDFTKLNDTPIWVSLKEKKSSLYYKDENVDFERKHIYAAAPNTIFNTSGDLFEIEVNLQDLPDNLTPPVLQNPVQDQGSLILEWTFPAEQESFIQGFYVQLEKADGSDFDNISELLPAGTRTFRYTALPVSDDQYYQFKVIAVRNDELELWSNRKVFYNKVDAKPSQPLGLKAEILRTGDDLQVKLSWEKPAQNATHVKEYYIYTSSPNQERVVKEGSISPVTEETYLYSVYRERAATYSFAVSAVNDQNEESELSEKATILIPSKSLPFINIWPIAKEGKQVTLNWKYEDDIADLAGFRLYQNGELIANENQLNAASRQWVSPELDAGRYNYEIIAVTTGNIESEHSVPRKFEIE